MIHAEENRREIERETAIDCIAIINRHRALNESEKMLLQSITNEIRLAYGLQGAVQPSPLITEDNAPKEWFW